MSLIYKLSKYKQSVKYHKLMVNFNYWGALFKLNFIKYFTNKKIHIIVLPEHIGDVIAFSPFAEKLKKDDKNTYVVWLINPKFLSIIEHNFNINYCIPIFCDGVAEKFSKNKNLKIYDVRFNGNNFCTICNTKRQYKKIDDNFNLENYYEYGSLLEIFSKLANKPMKKEDWQPTIYIPSETVSEIDNLNLPTKYICIHATSNELKREWAKDKWVELCNLIFKNQNIKIVQIGLKDNLKIQHPNFIDFCGKLSLIQTAEVIKRSQLYIGIDSGPAHMANATKAKSIILLGKYRDIVNYMPFSGNFANGIDSKIIYNPKIKCPEIEVEEVYENLQRFIL